MSSIPTFDAPQSNPISLTILRVGPHHTWPTRHSPFEISLLRENPHWPTITKRPSRTHSSSYPALRPTQPKTQVNLNMIN